MAWFRLAYIFVIAALATLGNGVAIKGIQTGVDPRSGRRPFRQEFSIFKNSGPAFDLYIQALLRFYERDQTALLSYFQVAGTWPVSLPLQTRRSDSRSRHTWRSLQILGWGRRYSLRWILYPY